MSVWPGGERGGEAIRPEQHVVEGLGVVSMVMANSAPAPAPAGDEAMRAPGSAMGIWSRSPVPHRHVVAGIGSRLVIGVPMCPSPRKAIFAMALTSLPGRGR